jgi:hypothetical protein
MHPAQSWFCLKLYALRALQKPPDLWRNNDAVFFFERLKDIGK